MHNKQNDPKIILATILSALFLIFWTVFYETPKSEQIIQQSNQKQQLSAKKEHQIEYLARKPDQKKILIDRSQIIKESVNNRIFIKNKNLYGSINLVGAKIDDINLENYKKELNGQENVALLSPLGSKARYFADFGWISNNNIDLPNAKTLWSSSSKTLSPKESVVLTWRNKQNIEFIIEYSIDNEYLLKIKQRIANKSNKTLKLSTYGRINKSINEIPQANFILHEGPLVVSNGIISEIGYDDLIEDNHEKNFKYKKGWAGITDKYWLTAIIPQGYNNFITYINHSYKNSQNIFNIEIIDDAMEIVPDSSMEREKLLFVGAKELNILDKYSEKYDISLFDRSVDFGWYYFLTKPFYFILKFFSNILGNYGLAILAMTILIKLLMLPMANKSYSTMGQMKNLQPEIAEMRKRYDGDKMQMNKALMDLYRSKKINPASGCLPVLIQIPIFFALYKVLFITIDMRQAPFYGWIKDLSAPDPTSIFNLFGLLSFDTPSFLIVGIWPILMGITMFLQQKLSPKAGDPIQAKVMAILPFALIFLFASFPAGLLIYWTWNNALSIIQQYIITKRLKS